MNYVYLGLAIVLETIGTSALTASAQFTRLWPSVLTVVAYLAAFAFLSLCFRTIPIGIAYAIWSGVGIVLISAVGFFIFKQSLDVPALFGLGLIILGVVIVNAFSKSLSH